MGKKKTHEEYVKEVAIINPNIEVIGKYINSQIKIAHKCKIDGFIWDAIPNNILRGKGCPNCKINKIKDVRRKTHEEYVAEVSEINSNIEVVGKYINTKTPILHKCKLDGYEWLTTPNTILSGCGCPKCFGNARKTHEEYIIELSIKNPNIKVVEKYIDAKTKIKHHCLIHDIYWNVTPDNALRNKGCPQCRNEATRNRVSKTHEEYVEKLKLANPNVIVLEKYKGVKNPILHKCIIHNVKWITSPASILQGCGCPDCKKEKISLKTKRTHQQYIEELMIKNPNVEVIEKYVNARTPILHHCLIHDVYWKVAPYHVLDGAGCLQCRNNKISEIHRKTHKEYVNELSIINQNIEVVDEYIGVTTPILHKCKIHNFEWLTTPASVLQGCGCPKCLGEKIRNKLVKSHEQYMVELREVNQHIIPLEKYISANKPILHKCSLDGNQWLTSPYKALQGYGCPQCNESKGENQVRSWLKNHSIVYEHQKKFDDCKDIKALPFDFYLPDYNTIIEYDGKQHFEPIEYFGGQDRYEYIIKHDKIKDEYCKNNGISLLRIPYFKNVEEELNNFLFI